MSAPSEAHPDRSPAETVEQIDATGAVVGLVSRSRMRAERLRHRSVFVAVVSESDQVLVHRRADTKDIWPGWWDLAVGGVCAPGETWDDAARRELSEELGLEGVPVHLLGTGAYDDDQVSLAAATFLCRCEGPFRFADGEIAEAHWVGRAELPAWLAAKRFLPDSLALVVPRLSVL